MNRAMVIGLGLSGLLHAAIFTTTTWQGSGVPDRQQVVHEVRLQLETPPSQEPAQPPLPQSADRVEQSVEPPTQEQAAPAPALLAAREIEQETLPQRITEPPPEAKPPKEIRNPLKAVSAAPSKTATPAPAKPAVTSAALPLARTAAVRPVVDPQVQTHYLAAVISRIQREKYYPRNARRRGEEGEVLVNFVIRKDGQIEGIAIDASSGHRRLDEAAIRTLQRASPVLPIPDALHRNRWEMSVPIAFSLRG